MAFVAALYSQLHIYNSKMVQAYCASRPYTSTQGDSTCDHKTMQPNDCRLVCNMLRDKRAPLSSQLYNSTALGPFPCVLHQLIKTKIIPETVIGLHSPMRWVQEAGFCFQEQFMGVKHKPKVRLN